MRRFVDRTSVEAMSLLFFFLFPFFVSIFILSLGVCPYENCNLTHELTFFLLSLFSVSTLDSHRRRRRCLHHLHRLWHRYCLFTVFISCFWRAWLIILCVPYSTLSTRYLNLNAHTKTVRLVWLTSVRVQIYEVVFVCVPVCVVHSAYSFSLPLWFLVDGWKHVVSICV